MHQRCEMLPGERGSPCPPLGHCRRPCEPAVGQAEPRMALCWRTILPAAGPATPAKAWEDRGVACPRFADEGPEHRDMQEPASGQCWGTPKAQCLQPTLSHSRQKKGEIISPLTSRSPFCSAPSPSPHFSAFPLVPQPSPAVQAAHPLHRTPPPPPCPPSPAPLSLGNVTLLSRLFTDKILLQACGRVFCCLFLK